jgi:nicotinate-nucleotide adenylyltransferase
MTRIGVLGGTFNPIHLGHLRAAEEVAEALDLERVLLVPSAQPPHKSRVDGPLAPGAQRLAWIEAACAGNPRLAPCDLEIARGGASYTVDTLRALVESGAAARPVFIIGSDAFAELGTWREPKQLFALADFAVMARPGTAGHLCDWIPESLRGDFELAAGGDDARHRATGGSVRAVSIPALAISSSEVRERVRRGRSIRYLVPEAVRRDIEASGVYAS